jgi:putative FmdB family regulatory protein
MPIYEYQCKHCGKITEFLVGVVQDKTEIKCKHCASTELNRIFSKSVISKSGNIIGSQRGKTCCGRDERCDTPPCSDGSCKR